MKAVLWLVRFFLIVASVAGVFFSGYLLTLFAPSREHQAVALLLLAASLLNSLYLMLHDRSWLLKRVRRAG
jgi:hypothetical protein